MKFGKCLSHKQNERPIPNCPPGVAFQLILFERDCDSSAIINWHIRRKRGFCTYKFLSSQEILVLNISHYKSGTYKKQYNYRSFSPEFINHEWVLDDSKINRLL